MIRKFVTKNSNDDVGLKGKPLSVLTIAHRLETIKDYDEIIVLEQGKV